MCLGTIAVVKLAAGIAIRPETKRDSSAIDEVVRSAFGSDVQVRLVHSIREGGEYQPAHALVAEVDGAVVGHVMVSHAVLVEGGQRSPVATLSPLAVAPSQQRRGVGSALVWAVLRRADLAGEPVVVLEGDPGYYRRFGFRPSTEIGITITLPSWAPAEAAQAVTLASYAGGPRGHLHFAALDGVEDTAG